MGEREVVPAHRTHRGGREAHPLYSHVGGAGRVRAVGGEEPRRHRHERARRDTHEEIPTPDGVAPEALHEREHRRVVDLVVPRRRARHEIVRVLVDGADVAPRRRADDVVAGACRAGVARGTERAAAAAVGRVRLRVGLAAVGGVAIAVSEARGAGADAAGAPHTGGRRVGEVAGTAAGTAIRGVGVEVDLATVGGVAIAVSEARCAGVAAHAVARHGRVRTRHVARRAGGAARHDGQVAHATASADVETCVAGEAAHAGGAGCPRIRGGNARRRAAAAVSGVRLRVDAAAAAQRRRRGRAHDRADARRAEGHRRATRRRAAAAVRGFAPRVGLAAVGGVAVAVREAARAGVAAHAVARHGRVRTRHVARRAGGAARHGRRVAHATASADVEARGAAEAADARGAARGAVADRGTGVAAASAVGEVAREGDARPGAPLLPGGAGRPVGRVDGHFRAVGHDVVPRLRHVGVDRARVCVVARDDVDHELIARVAAIVHDIVVHPVGRRVGRVASQVRDRRTIAVHDLEVIGAARRQGCHYQHGDGETNHTHRLKEHVFPSS